MFKKQLIENSNAISNSLMVQSKKNKNAGKKPLTYKAVLRITGMVIICIIMLIAIAERLRHYFHHHLTK